MQISQLQPKQMGTVRFDSDPHGANIYVDGQILTDPNTEESLKTPASVLLYEGRRNYTISIEGYEDASGYVDIYPGATVNIYKRLKQGASEEGWGQPEPQIWLSQQTGNITVTTNPSDAKIYVDDVMKGTTPAKLSLEEGYHYIVLEKEGYFQDFNRIYIYPGLDVELSRNLSGLPYSQYTPNQIEKYIQYYFMSDVIKSLQGPTTGTIVITSYPAGATVEMDGKMVIDVDTKEILETPVQMEVGMGQHDFIFRLEGYCNEFGTVYILPGTGATYINKTFYLC